MSDPKLEVEAEGHGFDDYEQGACEDDNPYMRGTQANEAWHAGWYRAYLHYSHDREMDEKDIKEIRRYS
jgi:hypothetical protein